MIGLFIKNKKNKICYLIADSENPDVKSFHYTKDSRVMTVTYVDDTEEIFVAEIPIAIHEGIIANTEILVAQMNEKEEAEREYTVPVTFGV